MIFGNMPKTRGEAWFAFFILIGFFGLLGSLFALLVPVIKGENLVLKSAAFGIMIWFLSKAVTVLYKVPELQRISLNDAISNFIRVTVWGVGLGFALGWLNKQVDHPVKPIKIN